MTSHIPPFRADHVGSLLRPQPVIEARHKFFVEHSISAETLKEVEDTAIPSLIKMQEDAGLRVSQTEKRAALFGITISWECSMG